MICFAFLLKLFLSIMARFTQSPNKGSLQTSQQNRRELHLCSRTFLFSRKTPLSCHCMTTLPEAKPIRKKKNQRNNNRTTATKNFSEVPWPQIVYRLSISTPTASTEDLLPIFAGSLSTLLPVDRKKGPKKVLHILHSARDAQTASKIYRQDVDTALSKTATTLTN